jgi:hypothetical protein
VLPSIWRWQAQATPPSHWVRWGVTNILLRLALNNYPPDLCRSSWDYRLEPLCLPEHFILESSVCWLDRASLCSPSCSWTCNRPASASWVLRL